MTAFLAAGHAFADIPGVGVACHCGVRWVNIRTAGRAEVGQHGIAHFGVLTPSEADAILARRAAEDDAIWAATLAECGA